MECKRLSTDIDFEQFAEVSSFSFGIKLDFNKKIIELIRKAEGRGKLSAFGVFEQDKLVSALIIFNFDMHFRNSILPMGGIAFVCSRPEYRGQGYIRYLLNKAIEIMNTNGQVVSTLYPFSINFYRKYGWELFETARFVKISASSIMDYDIKDYEFEILKSADEESIRFYNELVNYKYNLTLRDDWVWNNWILKSFNVGNLKESEITRQLIKVVKDDKIVALMPFVFYKDSEGKDRIRVEHIATKDKNNIKVCLNFLKKLSHQFSEFDIFLPMDLNINIFLKERTLKHEIKELAMLRVVNLEKLSGLQIGSDDFSLVIKVIDKNAPWNNGVFEIDCSNNVLNVLKSGKQPQLEMDIKAVALVFSGFLSLKDAINLKLVKKHTDIVVTENILPSETTFMVDFF